VGAWWATSESVPASRSPRARSDDDPFGTAPLEALDQRQHADGRLTSPDRRTVNVGRSVDQSAPTIAAARRSASSSLKPSSNASGWGIRAASAATPTTTCPA
jgi:hypothetical protein